MTIKYLTWTSYCKVDCSSDCACNAFFCVPEAITAPRACQGTNENVFVDGAGLADANGVYTPNPFDPTSYVKGVYTIFGNGELWILENATRILYTAPGGPDGPSGPWSTSVFGTNPAPTVYWHTNVAVYAYPYRYIDGQVLNQCLVSNGNGNSVWKIQLSYDDTQLLDGVTLFSSQISGVYCYGCYEKWVEDVAGNPVYLDVSDDLTQLTLVDQHGCGHTVPISPSGLAVGNLDGIAKSVKGGTINAGLLYFQTADATNPGLISTGTQVIPGKKNFADDVTLTSGDLIFGSGLIKQGPINLGVLDSTASFVNLLLTPAGVLTIRAGLIVTAGGVTLTSGNLTFGAASASIIPGVTSLLFRNHANTLTAIEILDSGLVKLRSGAESGTPTSRLGGTVYSSITLTGNVALTETILQSYTAPANLLNTSGDRLEVLFAGKSAATASTDKRIRVYLGATLILDTGSLSSATVLTAWKVEVTIIKSAAGVVQVLAALFISSQALGAYNFYPFLTNVSLSVTLTSTFIVSVTGVGTNLNDVLSNFATAKWESSST